MPVASFRRARSGAFLTSEQELGCHNCESPQTKRPAAVIRRARLAKFTGQLFLMTAREGAGAPF